MSDIAKKHGDRLDDLKDYVESWHDYFKDNVLRYKEFKKFVFKTGLTEQDINTLQTVGKPTIEFNILEAIVSRQRAEFAQNQPSLSVRAADGMPLSMLNENFEETIKLVEAHLRAMFSDGMNDALAYNVYSDLLAGGFSVMQVYTDYVSEKSFEQNIYVDRPFDPTLCGFDPLARDSHKGDGRFYFELYPMTRDDFDAEFGSRVSDSMSYSTNISGFSWSYKSEREDIVLVCDFYEKKKRKTKIMKLSNGAVVTQDEYDKFLEKWESEGRIEQPPIPVGKARTTEIVTIERYKFCETEVLSHEYTNFRQLPGVFIDGNSVMLSENNTSYQMTRPLVYHAKGIQRLKTFAGQSLANELENLVQHKWVAPIEGIPEDYKEAYENVQKADILLYNHFLDTHNPSVTIPPPREIMRPPIPAQISETFRMSDEMTQAILGSYDKTSGLKGAQLSGVAIARGAMQSNQAAVPYIMGYIKGLNQVANIVINLIPKYYRTPRSLPVVLPSGERSYQIINKDNSIYMNYDPDSLQVKVEAGANFAMQKEMALTTITSLMQASPTFAQFMNQEGLSILLDNLEIRGIDILKSKAHEFEEKIKKQEAQAQQMQQQAQQMQMKQQQQASQMQEQSMHLREQKQHLDNQAAERDLQAPSKEQQDWIKLQHQIPIDEAEMQLKEQQVQDDYVETVAKIQSDQVDSELKQSRIDAEQARSQINLAIEVDKHLTEK